MRLLALALALSTASFAGSVSVSRVAGTPHNAGALTGFSTTGSMMDGMVVTATFSDSTTQSAVWGTTGAGSGAASAAGFSLAMSGDTFSSPWTLDNLYAGGALMTLTVEARAGKTVFDTILDPTMSPGSARGNPFAYTPDPNSYPDARVVYRDQLSIGGTFYGDLYLTMFADFGSGLASGSSLSYIADTDNVPVDRPIDPVPEPSTLALLGLGGAAAWLARRKSQRA